MFQRPAVLGIDTTSPKMSPMSSTERMLQDLGNNTGNMLFSESLFTVLQNAKRCAYHFSPQDVEGCDVIVIAAANWISPYSDFGALAERIESTGLPLIVCGIGAQIYHGNKTPELKPGTMRLLKMASEHSKALSVRGTFSCEVLEGYGIKNTVATGCPSLLLAGSKGPLVRCKDNFEVEDVVLHSMRHLYNKVKGFQAYLYRESLRLDTDIILQSELVDMFVSCGSEIPQDKLELCDEVLQTTYRQDIAIVKSYLRKHGKVYATLPEWMKYMTSKRFCFGSRVHGTIVALLSGTPATLIAHDTRTEELAIAMGLPYVLERDVDSTVPLDPALYYSHAKFKSFIAHYQSYRSSFMEFFASVGLQFDSEFTGLRLHSQ